MIPFMGVRISWLMLARNSDLARFAASAAAQRLLHPQKHFLLLRDVDHRSADQFGLPPSPSTRDSQRIQRTVPSGVTTGIRAERSNLGHRLVRRRIQGIPIVEVDHLSPSLQRHPQWLSAQAHQRGEAFRHRQHLRRDVGLPDPERRGLFRHGYSLGVLPQFFLGAQPLDGVPGQVRARFHHAQVAVVRLGGRL